MHVGKNLLYGAVIIYEDFLGITWFQEGTRGKGGGGGRLLYQQGELREN